MPYKFEIHNDYDAKIAPIFIKSIKFVVVENRSYVYKSLNTLGSMCAFVLVSTLVSDGYCYSCCSFMLVLMCVGGWAGVCVCTYICQCI